VSRDFALIQSDVFPTTSQGSNGGALRGATREENVGVGTPHERTIDDVEFTSDGRWAAQCPNCGHTEIVVPLGFNPDLLVAQRETRRLRDLMERVADQLRRANGYEL
jgi:hypothetical protein